MPEPWGELELWVHRHRRVTIGEKTGTAQWVGTFVKTINVNSVSLPTVGGANDIADSGDPDRDMNPGPAVRKRRERR